MPVIKVPDKKSWNQGKINHNWRHGFACSGRNHPFYNAWCGMKARCYNKSSPTYRWYGAVGIKVCKRWVYNFKNFFDDMFPTWKRGLEIDRISSKKDYKPSNCRWADHYTQTRNHKRNHWITFRGEKRTITEWSKKIGGAHSLVRHRIRLGWSIERALTTPPEKFNRKKKCGNITQHAGRAATVPGKLLLA